MKVERDSELSFVRIITIDDKVYRGQCKVWYEVDGGQVDGNSDLNEHLYTIWNEDGGNDV